MNLEVLKVRTDLARSVHKDRVRSILRYCNKTGYLEFYYLTTSNSTHFVTVM